MHRPRALGTISGELTGYHHPAVRYFVKDITASSDARSKTVLRILKIELRPRYARTLERETFNALLRRPGRVGEDQFDLSTTPEYTDE